jgi:hypothetical protein
LSVTPNTTRHEQGGDHRYGLTLEYDAVCAQGGLPSHPAVPDHVGTEKPGIDAKSAIPATAASLRIVRRACAATLATP